MSRIRMETNGVSGDKDDGTPKFLFGVSLLSDGSGEQLSPLGVAIVSPAGTADRLPVSRVRQIVNEQIETMPPSFRFFTSQRWPISKKQEEFLNLQCLLSQEGCVYVQQTYEKPKIGIKAKTGVPVGFVLAETDNTLAFFRSLINSEVSFFKGISDGSYQFLDSNGWPVSKPMEQGTRVRDVLVKSCVTVCTDRLTRSRQAGDDVDGDCPLYSREPPRKKLKSLKQLSFRSGKDVDRLQSTPSSAASNADCMLEASASNCSGASGGGGTTAAGSQRSKKQLLISYVRAEAADYALHLKTKLAALGFSVYLDVHEISVGVDWQDSLNFAVSNCEVFIPLLTPRYGETLWTNREVKLADVLGKYILPVNFLRDWPPRCLAIQFATTQYVMSGHPYAQALVNGNGAAARAAVGGESSGQAANWTDADIGTTAMEISQRIKALNKTGATLLSIPSLVRMKTLRKTFVGKLPAAKLFLSEGEGDIAPHNNNSTMIVICLHPAQSAFGQEVKQWLEDKAHTVWLSCDKEFPVHQSDTLPAAQLSPGETPSTRDDNSGRHGDGGYQIAPFQSVADRAAVVVIILSQDFAHSHTCKQQLFYCEQRKPLVPIHFEDFTMPGWLSMLIGNDTESSAIKQSNYRETLVSRVQRVLHSSTRNNLELLGNEAKLNHAVEHIRKTVATDTCVYVAGSTTFYDPKSEEICRAIGRHLAGLGGLSLATGGFYGVGETVSQAFHEETQRLWKRQDVWHILPDRDVKNWREQANQNPDGTFAVASFGKTLFCGDSVRQRESIVGRCFEICMLVEGGPGAAHEAEEFVWNDRAVIPIVHTGGAASGKFSAPLKMFETPQGVSSPDWQALSAEGLTPAQTAESVGRIVSSLLLHLSHSKDLAATTTTTTTTTPQPGARGKKASPPAPTTPTLNPPSPGARGKKATPPSPTTPTPGARGMKATTPSLGSLSSSTITPNARKKSALNKMKTVLLG